VGYMSESRALQPIFDIDQKISTTDKPTMITYPEA